MRPRSASNFTSLDIIPDIHGQLDKLEALLSSLGYQNLGTSWRHSERKVLFLGDYIDRGPKVRGTLHLVKSMVDQGEAIALMGNHEFNAIGFHTKDASGRPLREHSSKNIHQHQTTLDDFASHESELASFVEWMKGLPLFLDLGDLRAVHACWCEKSIRLLAGADLRDHDFLMRAYTKGNPEYDALEVVLKGPESPLPKGMAITDKDGTSRDRFRVCWWGHGKEPRHISEIFMPPGGSTESRLLPVEALRDIPNYPTDLPPVFFGHYWMAPDWPKAPLAPAICCLDYSAGKGGPLVAYRWDGKQPLSKNRFFTVESFTNPNEHKPEDEMASKVTPEEIEETERHRKEWAEKEMEIRARVSRENPDLID